MPRQHLLMVSIVAALSLAVAPHPADASTAQEISARPGGSFELRLRGSFAGGGPGASEIVGFDAASQQLFVTNGALNRIDVINISNVDTPLLARSIDLTPYGSSVQGVAAKNGLVVAAIAGTDEVTPGVIAVFDASTGAFRRIFPAGVLPDHVSFSPDGNLILAANEGEVGDLGVNDDPPGSVTVIDISGGLPTATVTQIDFSSLDAQQAALRAAGVRFFGEALGTRIDPIGNPMRPASRDLEPEYIAVSPDNTVAWVSLQEANAFARINLVTKTLIDVIAIPLKDHSLPGNRLDPSDRDGAGGGPAFLLRSAPVFGMHMPDSIASFSPVRGPAATQTFFASAGEGDDRGEDIRIGNNGYVLDPTLFPDAAALKSNAVLGRLGASSIDGDIDGDGDIDQIHVYGSRSFSLFDSTGARVYDSGAELECITASRSPEEFNSDNEENGSADSRSDNKGPEPEAIAAGTTAEQRSYVFVGLERIGGVAVYDVTNPADVFAVEYVNNRDFSTAVDIQNPETFAGAGDFAPEGIIFIPAADSPTGGPMIAVSNEVSGTTTLYSVEDALFRDQFESPRFSFACS